MNNGSPIPEPQPNDPESNSKLQSGINTSDIIVIAPVPRSEFKLFTIRQLCRGLGISRQAVFAGFYDNKIVPGGKVDVAGKAADAWPFASLPLDWQLRITRRAVFRDFSDGEEYLATLSHVRFRPKIPWDKICERQQKKAKKLMKAMEAPIEERGKGKLSRSKILALGLEEYKTAVGRTISSRHWWRLYDLIILRDGGDEIWEDRELYLDERQFSDDVPPEAIEREYQHRAVDDAVESLQLEGQKLKRSQRQFFWDAVFYHFETLLLVFLDFPATEIDGTAKPLRPTTKAEGVEYRAIKQSLIHKIFKAFPDNQLAQDPQCIRRTFDYRYLEWIKTRTSSSTKDDRDQSGREGHHLCEVCAKELKRLALDRSFAAAWRKMNLDGTLCPKCRSYWQFNDGKNKSYVPKAVVDEIAPDVLAARQFLPGPKRAKQGAPYIKRNWKDTGPGHYAVLDDATPDHVTFGDVEFPLPLAFEGDKNSGFFIGRLEGLFQVDERTDYPQAFLFILGEPPAPGVRQKKASYNAVHQRLLILRAHDQLGLPSMGFWMENGPWRNRLNDGEPLHEWNTMGHVSFANGLADATRRTIRRALPGNPRSKIIERVFLAIWAKMAAYPTYMGAMKRGEKRELLFEFIARVKQGKEDPASELPNVQEFRSLVGDTIKEFREEKQDGERLPGVSPLIAWEEGIGGWPGYLEKPLEKYGDSMRFLLSTHERVITVGSQGIIFEIAGTKFVYWGKELEDFQHKPLLCRFNFEEPEMLSCCATGGKPFVTKCMELRANTATPAELSNAQRLKASWLRRNKIIFDDLRHNTQHSYVNDNRHSREARDFGTLYQAQQEKFQREKDEAAAKANSLNEKAKAQGIVLPSKIKHTDAVEAALDERQAFWEQLRAEENAENPENPRR